MVLIKEGKGVLLEEEIKQERIGGEKIEREGKIVKIKRRIRKNIEGEKITPETHVNFLCILII
jgi:hypothetical protein